MNKFVIYKVTNLETGKVYVGKSSGGLTKRRQMHLATAKCLGKESSIFHRALNSYGEEAFFWEVLEECLDHEHMNAREVFHIAAANCQHPNGYNMTLGGGSYGFQRSPETKELLAQKMREVHARPEYQARVYPKLKGLVPPNKGVPMSEEQKVKVGKARKAAYEVPGYVNPNVGQKRTGEALDNLHKSYETRDLPTGEAWKAAHGNQYTEEVRIKMRAAKLGKKPANTKRVQCIETGEIFQGLTDAALGTGVNRQSIYLQIKGKLKSAGGKHFKYLA